MQRIVLDMKGGLLAEAVMQSLSGFDPDFLVPYDGWRLSERLKLCSAVKQLGWGCKVLLLVDENSDKMLASEVRQAVKDQLADNFIYASVSPAYLAGVIDTL